jgi:hypothetical protein
MFNKLSPIGFNPVTYSMGGYDQWNKIIN